MGIRKIVIIGGGISGLSVLHYLKQRFKNNVDITLFERESKVGGTIRTIEADGPRFEWGPNGFLDNQPNTLQFIKELGLTDQLIEANPASRRRYILFNRKLHLAPMNPLVLLFTPLLSLGDKFRLIKGIFLKDISTDQSIYDYIHQRFGVHVAERLVDPFMSGIFGGDIKRLHMASAFPKIFGGKGKGKGKTRMRSFKKGMGQLTEALYERYSRFIQTDMEAVSLGDFQADLVILATPAYVTAKLLETRNAPLSDLLQRIPYAPIAVAGLTFKQKHFKRSPDGFGFLVPSSQSKDVLGVLIDTNVFLGRAGKDQVLLRVMMGGAHHPAMVNDEASQIVSKAIHEVDDIYGIKQMPLQTFVKIWPKAIPQYGLEYPQWRQKVTQQLRNTPEIRLCANYLDGISLNDCILNARALAYSLEEQG